MTCTAVSSEAWAKLRADFLILPRDVHSSLLEIGERENNKRCVFSSNRTSFIPFLMFWIVLNQST